MSACAQCDRPATVRGMCTSHYTINYKRRRYLAGTKSVRVASLGVARRLQALVAIGYTLVSLSRQLGIHQSYLSKLSTGFRPAVNPGTAEKVTALYDRLSMTPGQCQQARRRARQLGWAPPLAWDDDTIDDPDATPAPPARSRDRRTPYRERFLELRELGYTDLEIADRWNIAPGSLLRQLIRHGIPATALLVEEANRIKYAREVAS